MSKFCKLSYIDDGFNLTLNVGGGYSGYNIFRGNSVYDPDVTGVGVQPYYYDQLTTVYAYYAVNASKITVYPCIDTSITSCPRVRMWIIPVLRDTLLTNYDPSDLSAMDKKKQLVFNNSDNPKHPKLSMYMSSRKALGTAYNRYGTWAGYTANPTTMWYWHVYFDSSEGPWDATLHFSVKITYYLRLTRANSVNES